MREVGGHEPRAFASSTMCSPTLVRARLACDVVCRGEKGGGVLGAYMTHCTPLDCLSCLHCCQYQPHCLDHSILESYSAQRLGVKLILLIHCLWPSWRQSWSAGLDEKLAVVVCWVWLYVGQPVLLDGCWAWAAYPIIEDASPNLIWVGCD